MCHIIQVAGIDKDMYNYLSLILITSLGSDSNAGLLHRSSYVTMDCMKLSAKTKHQTVRIEIWVLLLKHIIN